MWNAGKQFVRKRWAGEARGWQEIVKIIVSALDNTHLSSSSVRSELHNLDTIERFVKFSSVGVEFDEDGKPGCISKRENSLEESIFLLK